MASEEIYDRRSDGKLTCLAAVALDHEGRLIPKTHTIPDFVKNLYTIQNFDKNKNWIENSSISTEFFSASFDDFINPQHPQKIFSYEDFYTYLKKVITLLNCIDEREIKFITTINIKKIISPIKSNKIEINIPDEEFLDDIEKNEEILNKKIRSLKIFPSLYTKDLSKIITSIKTKPCGKSLKEYLNDGENIEKKDIYNNHTELQNVIAPHYIPSAKWPRNDTLSLAQQASLNIALREKEGLFSINGPPGTGKTTLLRDVISEIIVKRAEVLIQFNSPKNAFERSIKTNDGFILKSHQINPKLCGFEIIVATSNNNAAENVSKELPSLNEIDLNSFNDHPENNYFSHVAEYYSTNEKLWGCISAALGNQENLRNFLNTFWNKHHPSSMRYLLERWNFHDEEFNQVVKSGLYTYSDKYLWIRQKFYEIDVEYKKKWK